MAPVTGDPPTPGQEREGEQEQPWKFEKPIE